MQVVGRSSSEVLTILGTLGALLLAVIIAAVASAGDQLSRVSAAGPTSSASSHGSAPAKAGTLAVGDSAQIQQNGATGADISITSVRLSTQPGDAEFGQQPQNGYYVIASVRVNSRASYDINPLDFYTVVKGGHYDEGDGNAYDAVSNSNVQLEAATLNPGEHTTGKLLFDVPAAHGRIVYAPNLDGGAVCSWKF